MHYHNTPTKDLLILIIGERTTDRLYSGVLDPLFNPKGKVAVRHRKLLAARELISRWMKENLAMLPVLSQPDHMRAYLRLHFAGAERERFAVLFFNGRHRLIAAEDMFLGTLDGAFVYPREVVKRALEWNAASVVLAHNHPSGDVDPSHADEQVTLRIRQALELVDVRVMDHLIIGEDRAFSFSEHGLL